jgi:hypothetical protein
MKYASIMMGIYFAATGFGNKLAGSIGEASQLEKYKGEMVASVEEVNKISEKTEYNYLLKGKEIKENDFPVNLDMNMEFKSSLYIENDEIKFERFKDGTSLDHLMSFDTKNSKKLMSELKDLGATKEQPMHAKLFFEKDEEAVKNNPENKGDGQDYGVSFIVEETQNKQEFNIFMWIVIYTVAFGILLILFLKKLKALTHGAEDNEGTINEEAEGFELADGE